MKANMAKAAPKPCGHPGCGVLVRDGTSRCPRHPSAVWAKKPTPTKRITGRRLMERIARKRAADACRSHSIRI